MYVILSLVLHAQCQSGTGQGTFYDVNNPAENDGYTSQFRCPVSVPENGIYVAVPSSCFSSGNSICGTMVTVSYKGKSIQVPILDECASCEGDHIDLSTRAFSVLESNLNVGILHGITWLPNNGAASAAPAKPVAPRTGSETNTPSKSAAPASSKQQTKIQVSAKSSTGPAVSNKINRHSKQKTYSPIRRCKSLRLIK